MRGYAMKERTSLDGSVEEQCKDLTRSLAGGVKQSNSLSGSESHEYLNSVSSEYRRSVRKLNKRVLKVLEVLVGSGVGGKQVDEVFDSVVEYAEDALEVALTNVEEIGRDGDEEKELSRSGQFRRPSANLGKHHVKKPQYDFDDWPIDNSDTPFIPIAERKNPQLSDSVRQHVSRLSINNESVSLKHPYENEILQAAKSSALLPVPDKPRLWGSFEKTEFTFVEDEADFEIMLEKLMGEKEIAVDLENHSERSYQVRFIEALLTNKAAHVPSTQGFCCLMQISTRSEDFVIDAIKLRSKMIRMLPIFCDPEVVKVLHGANHDVQWLERDFGLYIVNLFDTFASTKLLELQGSLAFLLEFFCDVKNSNKKKFQRSDWRVRPLPEDQMNYARSDTHYLLYIYDRLRSMLNEKGVLEECWLNSSTVALRRYAKPRLPADASRRLLDKSNMKGHWRTTRVVNELLKWRDTIARREDDSPQYVDYLIRSQVIFSGSKPNIKDFGSCRFVLANQLVLEIAGNAKRCASERQVQKLSQRVGSEILSKEAASVAQIVSDTLEAKSPPPTDAEETPSIVRKDPVHTRFDAERSEVEIAEVDRNVSREKPAKSASFRQGQASKDSTRELAIHDAQADGLPKTMNESEVDLQGNNSTRLKRGVSVVVKKRRRSSLFCEEEDEESYEEDVNKVGESLDIDSSSVDAQSTRKFQTIRTVVHEHIAQSTKVVIATQPGGEDTGMEAVEGSDVIVIDDENGDAQEKASSGEDLILLTDKPKTAEMRRKERRDARKKANSERSDRNTPDQNGKPSKDNRKRKSYDYSSAPWSLAPTDEQNKSNAFNPGENVEAKYAKYSRGALGHADTRRSSGSKSMSYKTK
ncbi:hypothetical protein NDN08_003236 [Rhodosorus marinus]|uniref:3'-5' exonuclease domain-containing protein n=1 Tax=Rhodosorus marinus TaxID=101924 RepID=A0AAV8V0I7_9RHOD|nr:hypothetical protein NDN08_003236 [Rhodosorus marinus]